MYHRSAPLAIPNNTTKATETRLMCAMPTIQVPINRDDLCCCVDVILIKLHGQTLLRTGFRAYPGLFKS